MSGDHDLMREVLKATRVIAVIGASDKQHRASYGVMRFLQEKGWLEPKRLSAVGYAYYKPVASNDTAEGRRQNRRIEIILVPKR